MTGKYQPYPAYKNSGVEWLGKIPSHWAISKLRYEFSFGKGLSITKANLSETGVPCINYGEVHSKYAFAVNPQKHPLKCVSDNYLEDHKRSLLTHGDIVFADTSEDLDGSGNFTQLRGENTAFAGYHTIIARPKNRKCNRFYAYLLESQECRTHIRTTVKGVKVFSITQEILRGTPIWLPPMDERKEIAKFLDHQTASIDTLIAKQEKLIELLQEKRQAVISHAVTKGLDPDVPMKDSGVDWLGEVPAHWKVIALKNIVEMPIIDGPHESPSKTDEGIPFVSAESIRGNEINFKQKWGYISQKDHKRFSKRYVPQKGDILMVKLGATTGAVALVTTTRPFNIWVPLAAIRINKENSSQFIANALQSDSTQNAIKISWTFGTQQTLGLKTLGNIRIALPPHKEQNKICDHIAKRNKSLHLLLAKSIDSLSLLKERRTALISAAVTGKIDVRNWKPSSRQDA